jgi:hypothetical protein
MLKATQPWHRPSTTVVGGGVLDAHSVNCWWRVGDTGGADCQYTLAHPVHGHPVTARRAHTDAVGIGVGFTT